MVSTSSSNAALDSEKRRKQTLERAKANHLSRQLQMRLQYARLKVEHGWQKQSLNEVENLYFHHSMRGSKLYSASPSVPTTQEQRPLDVSSSSPSESSLSLKLDASNLTRDAASTALGEIDTEVLSSEDPNMTLVVTDSSPHQPPYQHPYASLLPMDAINETSQNTAELLTMRTPPPQQSGAVSSQPPEGITSPQSSIPNPDSIEYTTNHYPSVKPSRSRLPRTQSTPKSTPSLSNKDFYSGGSLTYDSFWSSHTGPTNARQFRPPSGKIVFDVGGSSGGAVYDATINPAGGLLPESISFTDFAGFHPQQS